ncbi:MAG: ATP-binding protein [Gammaproteobacteria bacterium]|nr:ATP-binding protein [Gammaproteobacteria bacterium]
MRARFSDLWRRERLGLTMIVSSMAVIAVTVFLLLNFDSNERVEQLRRQGPSITRILADIPFPELRSRHIDYSPLRILQIGQDDEDFAYAVVVDNDGAVLNAVNSPVVDVGRIATDVPQGVWSGERQVNLPGANREVLEFFSPVVEGEDIMGTVRIGYFMPSLGLDAGQLPFLGSMALAIFLLTPLFYFTVRREIQPIKAVNDQIAARIDQGQFNSCTIEASGELSEFIDRFNKFTDLARSKIESLEQNNNELIASQKLLSYRKLRIEAVLKAIPEAVLILGEDGSVSYANEKVSDLLGVQPVSIMHRKPSQWCKHAEALSFLSRFEEKTTSNFYTETARFTSPIAEQKKLSIKAYPLFSPKDPDAIFGRLIILRDATKEALAEEGRANFVAHVSHELKNPLNTLGLYAEALKGEQGQEESFRIEAYNVIHDEVERLASLVDNLLNITKIEMGNLKIDKQRVRLQDLLRDAFEHVSTSGRAKGLEFNIDMPPELTAVAVDKDLLRIAINNLLVNAIKYTPSGGSVTLQAGETDSAIEIRVSDTGIGIAQEDQDKIFDKFYRAESDQVREVGGHGLGLPLAKEIIELHRGQLSVSSQPGQGSEFLISLWKDSGLMKQAI